MSVALPVFFVIVVFFPYIAPLRIWFLLPAFGSWGDREIDMKLVRLTFDLDQEQEWLNRCRAQMQEAKSGTNQVAASKAEENFNDAEKRVKRAHRRLDRAIGIGMINGYGKTVVRFVR